MRLDVADLVLAELQAGNIERSAAVKLLQQLNQQMPIAVVGMSAMMGDTDDYNRMWEHYRQGGSFIDRAAQERGDLIRSAMPQMFMQSPRQMAKGNFIDDIHSFDYELFGYTEEEAKTLFPHARLVLMAAYRAVEDAGLTGEYGAEHRTGVYTGYNFVRDQMNSYLNMGIRNGGPHEEMMFGSWTSGIATRVSRAFDFRGPSQMIDGACASSTISIVTACKELSSGDIDAALAGGFYLDLTPIGLLNQPGVFATGTEDVVPKLYSQNNEGGFGGEFFGFVVLKTLDRAVKDGDRIHGVIRGWAESNSGASGGFDQTSPESVQVAVREVLKSAKTSAEDIGLVLGEGFAQPIEEALETDGLAKGMASLTDRKQFAAISTASPATGYMQSAIGVAQLQLMVQALRDQVIPGMVHFDNPTGLVDLADSPFYVPLETQGWPEPEGVERRGLVYSNAYGGFYLTLVVGPAPEDATPVSEREAPATGELVFTVSASNLKSLRAKIETDLSLLRSVEESQLGSLCYSSCARQFVHDAYRVAVVGTDRGGLIAALEEVLAENKLGTRLSGEGWDVWAGTPHGRASSRRAPKAQELSARETAERFSRGEKVRFTSLFAPKEKKFVPLGRYEFDRQPTWIVPKLTIEQMKESAR